MEKTKKLQDYRKPLSSNLTVTNSQRIVAISLPSAREVLHFLITSSKQPEMALHFIGKKRISSLHASYFDDPSPTDCITFPYEDPNFLGEVFVCPQTAQEYVEQNKGDLYEEITLYIVHGFLHLIGYDDLAEETRKEMRIQEKKWMTALAKNNLRVTP